MFERLRHLGLQRRIMLFVVVGLSLMFGSLAVIGLGAIDQATQLVFRERLSTAYTTAAILERDLGQVAAGTREEGEELGLVDGTSMSAGAAQALLDRLEGARYPFFRVTGLWLLDRSGHLLYLAGSPTPATGGAIEEAAILASRTGDGYVIGQSISHAPGSVGFATAAVPLAEGSGSPIALVHLASINATVDYDPAAFGDPLPLPGATAAPATATGGVNRAAALGYHLEVVDPDGVAVLGIGSDERPGQMSPHYPRIKSLMADGQGAALVHLPGPGESFEPHVMAVVPLPSTPMYVVIEQPIDVALALPHELQTRLFLTTILGFLGALAVAWITTRHVVKPTEELTAAAGRIAAGDLASPIAVRAEDEIGLLAESLEQMRRQLAEAREELQRANSELERRVEDRTARINTLLGQTINAQEEERRRLARELHDETAQSLAALGITLDRVRDAVGSVRDSVSPEAPRLIAEARQTAADLLDETRRLMAGLRPALLDDLGLVPAIRAYAEATLTDGGVEVAIDADEVTARLPAHLEVALFRIIQEAITNVARHARARHVTVALALSAQRLTVSVTDDGVGFDLNGPATTTIGTRLGLVGIQERVRLIGGDVGIESGTDHGTRIYVSVPYDTGTGQD